MISRKYILLEMTFARNPLRRQYSYKGIHSKRLLNNMNTVGIIAVGLFAGGCASVHVADL